MVGYVFESVCFRFPNKGFRACLGDLPPDMPETWVSLCNLMLKLTPTRSIIHKCILFHTETRGGGVFLDPQIYDFTWYMYILETTS